MLKPGVARVSSEFGDELEAITVLSVALVPNFVGIPSEFEMISSSVIALDAFNDGKL